MTNSIDQRTKEIDAYLEQSRINLEAGLREHKSTMDRIYKELERRSKLEVLEVQEVQLIKDGVTELFNTTFTSQENLLLSWAFSLLKKELDLQFNSLDSSRYVQDCAFDNLTVINALALKLGVEL